MEDRDRVFALVGHKVAVNLNNVEARGVEIIGTLDELHEDGIVLSEVGELGPGPTMFCPWDSLKRYDEWLPWLGPPHEEPEPGEEPQEQEYYDLYEWREATTEEIPPMPAQGARPSARTLDHVVPIAQWQAVGEVVIALTSLELYEEGLGVLRYRISYEEGMFEGGYGIPEPELVVRDGFGRELSWSPRGSSASDGEADGEVEVREVPEAGELEVEVVRVATLVFDEEVGEEVAQEAYDGPWTFRFSI